MVGHPRDAHELRRLVEVIGRGVELGPQRILHPTAGNSRAACEREGDRPRQLKHGRCQVATKTASTLPRTRPMAGLGDAAALGGSGRVEVWDARPRDVGQ